MNRLSLALLLLSVTIYAWPIHPAVINAYPAEIREEVRVYQEEAFEALCCPEIDHALLLVALEGVPKFWQYYREEIDLDELPADWELVLWRYEELKEEMR